MNEKQTFGISNIYTSEQFKQTIIATFDNSANISLLVRGGKAEASRRRTQAGCLSNRRRFRRHERVKKPEVIKEDLLKEAFLPLTND